MTGMSTRMVFRPRPSHGWAWLASASLVVLAAAIVPILINPEPPPLPALLVTGGIGLGIGLPMLILSFWFPTMRYELDDASLTLIYGPVLHYRIPLGAIRSIRHRDLRLSLWSSLRLPGLALFRVPYADVGKVNMCSTAALQGILLIETDGGLFGLTPADEKGLLAELSDRMGA